MKKHQNKEACVKDALVTQLNFHRDVLGSKGNRELFQQSTKGKLFSVDELTDNLRTVLLLNPEADETISEPKKTTLTYKNLENIQSVVQENKQLLSAKMSSSRNKIIIEQQKQKLPALISNPEKLVGKRIKHKCMTDTREIEWYHGSVVGIHKGKVQGVEMEMINGIKTEYDVKYDDDDEIWFFDLLKDLSKGDLMILN